MSPKIFRVLVVITLCVAGSFAHAQDSTTESEDTAKIKAAIQSYVAAFNSKNVDQLTSHWSPDGVYTSRTTGETSVGRKAMSASFKELFKNETVPKLAVATESIEFISPSVALETGAATITHSENDVVQTQYSVVYVKRDGQWLIDRVTESEIVIEESHYDELQDLKWLIGDWTVEGDGFRVEFGCQWTAKDNFISRTFKIFDEEGAVSSSGLQIIGWDENSRQIRSWLFDSDGGVVNGVWQKRSDGGWAVQSEAILADGGKGSFTSIFRLKDDGNFYWKKINRVLDGKLLPNVDEIEVQRK